MRIASWNVQAGLGVDGRVDLPRLAARLLAWDPDVVCLQEVSDGFDDLPGAGAQDQFAAHAALWPGYLAVEGVATDWAGPGRRRRFGNVLLSRLPVGVVLRHLLPWPAQAGEPSMQRVAVEATVQAPFGPLRVLTTHLEYYGQACRREQVERLRELQLQALAHAAAPRRRGSTPGPFDDVPRGRDAIILGDFNFDPSCAEYARLQAPGPDGEPPWRDAWALLHPDAAHPPTVGVHDRAQWPQGPRTFDFAFVGPGLAPRLRAVVVDAQARESDHQPLLVELA